MSDEVSKKQLHILEVGGEGPYKFQSSWGHAYRYEVEDFKYSIICPGPTECHGWQECLEDHTGHDYEDDGDEEADIHGEPHTWVWGYGWTVAYKGCVVQGADCGDSAYDVLVTYGPGRYLVNDDWDDGSVYIEAVSMEDGSPLPDPGWMKRCMDEQEKGQDV